jgi:hypothetical protein
MMPTKVYIDGVPYPSIVQAATHIGTTDLTLAKIVKRIKAGEITRLECNRYIISLAPSSDDVADAPRKRLPLLIPLGSPYYQEISELKEEYATLNAILKHLERDVLRQGDILARISEKLKEATA